MDRRNAAQEALARLKEGNARFVAGEAHGAVSIDDDLRRELARGQSPPALILGCSDSRVPPEIVFDQPPGELFVVRVAGNVASPTQIGSVEFAVDVLSVPLVVVLGHASCGAVAAALQVAEGAEVPSPGLGSIVERVLPSVEAARAELGSDSPDVLDRAVHLNVQAAIRDLIDGSDIVRTAVEEGRVMVVGGEYPLDSGRVDFFEDG